MQQTIDATGLTPEEVQAVEALVRLLRDRTREAAPAGRSIFDLFGKAPQLRSGEEVARQLEEEREAGDPR